MDNVTSSGQQATSSATKRNVVIAVAGVALAAIGLAAGLSMRPSTTTADPAPVATVQQPEAVAPRPAVHHRATPVPSQTVAANDGGGDGAYQAPRPAAVCATCGVVESVRSVRQEGSGSGLGAVTGGLLGGVVGNRFGGGGGRTALTVLGAVGGGLAGNEVEKRTRATTSYEVQVRMDDGSLRSFQQSTAPAQGAHVVVDGSTLRMAGNGN